MGIHLRAPRFASLAAVAVSTLLLWAWGCQPSRAQELLWRTHDEAGAAALRTGDLPGALKQYEAALRAAERFPENDGRLSDTMRAVARLYDETGRFDEAERIYRRLLSIDERQHGVDSAKVAVDLIDLAMTNRHHGRYSEAETMYRKAAEILERQGSGAEAMLVRCLINMVVLSEDRHKPEEARALLKRALTLIQKTRKPEYLPVLDTITRLYERQSCLPEAESVCRLALGLRQHSQGEENHETRRNLVELAILCDRNGKTSEADELVARFNDTGTASSGGDREDSESLELLARFYRQRGKAEDAASVLERALELNERKYGAKHARVARTLSVLGLTCMDTDDYQQAERFLRRALIIDDELFGGNHPDVAVDLSNLGLLFLNQGKYRDSETCYRRALAIVHSTLGKDHPDASMCMSNLALLLLNKAEYVEAESLLKSSLDLREKSLGPQHALVRQNLVTLAEVYRRRKQFEQALPLLTRALRTGSASLDTTIDNGTILRELADTHTFLRNYTDAEEAYRQLLAIDQRIAGQESAAIASDLEGLARVLTLQGKTSEAKAMRDRAVKIKAALPGAAFLTSPKRLSIPLPAAADARQNPITDKWALVIGISNFEDQSLNLKFAAKDATDFKNYLVGEAGFAPDHVRLLTDKQATRDTIVASLGDKWLGSQVKQNDLVVIFISSHGSEAKQEVGANFIVTHETNPANLVLSGIPMQWLTTGIRDLIRCDHIILILDVCHGEAAGSAITPARAAESSARQDNSLTRSGGKWLGSSRLDSTGKGIARQSDPAESELTGGGGPGELVLVSSQADQISWESKKYPNGVFTRQLISGLRQHGPGTTIGQAFDYLKAQVEEEVLRDRQELQTPVLIDRLQHGEDIVVAAPPAKPGSRVQDSGAAPADKD